MSEDNLVCRQQPNLNCNCQLVCVKSLKFLTTDCDENNEADTMTIVLRTSKLR